MNRKQKRAFIKCAKKKGVREDIAELYAEIDGNITDQGTSAQAILEDEKVKLNVDAITGRENYSRMTAMYKEFIDNNIDTVFTAHVERPNLISFKEEPKWLFWSGDLIRLADQRSSSED